MIAFSFPILEHFCPFFRQIAQMGLILPCWGLVLPRIPTPTPVLSRHTPLLGIYIYTKHPQPHPKHPFPLKVGKMNYHLGKMRPQLSNGGQNFSRSGQNKNYSCATWTPVGQTCQSLWFSPLKGSPQPVVVGVVEAMDAILGWRSSWRGPADWDISIMLCWIL